MNKKVKYRHTGVHTKKSDSEHTRPLKCFICNKTIRAGEQYNYRVGYESHVECLEAYKDDEGYVHLDDKQKPIKRI